METLRQYQSRSLEELRALAAQGKRRLLLVAPTGSGKTTIASALIHSAVERGSSVLFLAHRRELIDQCVARLAEHGIRAGVILAGRPASDSQVQVASVQTLARRPVPPSSIVVVDESHHARAESYQRPLAANPDAVVIGLTATPWRTDGRGLGELFSDVVVAARPRELIQAGYLVPVTGFSYDAPELKQVRTTGGDYDADQAAEVMSYLGGNIVQRWLDHRPGRTVLFACTVEHSQRLTAAFCAAGVRAEHLDGTTPLLERAGILARLAAGDTELVCNVGVLTEGWDLPALACVILARPTKSVGLYLQMAGRGLRPATGKECLRLHDHAGNALHHGLPDEDRDYSLASDTRRQACSIRTRTCPRCYAIFAPAPRCPACGHVFAVSADPRKITLVSGVEVELSRLPARKYVSSAVARVEYQRLAEVARSRGYRLGWAKMRFKERFNFWPPKAWEVAA